MKLTGGFFNTLHKDAQMKAYAKPVLVRLGSLALIKSNATGPSSDGKKYAGFFK